MSNELEDFHNLTYLPVSDGAANKLTKATSTNIYGGWAEFSFRMDEYSTNKYLNTFASLSKVNGSDFITSDGTIKAGNYYIEIDFVSAGISSTIEIPLSFNNIVAGFPHSLYPINQFASSTLSLIVRFDTDTRLRTNNASVSKMKTLFIASYNSIGEEVRDFNKLTYLPLDEGDDLLRYSAGIKYGTRPVATAYPTIPIMNSQVNWGSESGEKLPETAGDTPPWYHGYWRTYACGQVDTGTTLMKIGNRVSRGGDSLIQTGYFPEISIFGQQVYSSIYTYRISDYTPYKPENPTIYALGDARLPSFRKNTSKIVHTVATVDFWDNGYLNNTYLISNPFRSRTIILPSPELANWTWFSEPRAVLVSYYCNNFNDKRNHTFYFDDGNGMSSVKLGYNHPTVMVHVGGNIGFELASDDGENLGKFFLSVTFLP